MVAFSFDQFHIDKSHFDIFKTAWLYFQIQNQHNFTKVEWDI